MSGSLLALAGVEAGYGEIRVLNNLSLGLAAGEIVAVVGPNGAGKSTVLKVIMGLLRPNRGEVRLDDEGLTGLQPHEIVRRGVSFVPQGQVVFPYMTVDENLHMGAFVMDPRRFDVKRARERVLAMFPRLEERLQQRAGSMSGGEQQMVALARALMTEPRVLLLDEPSLGLSPRFTDMVFDKLLELRNEGLGIILVEQNAAHALEIADRGYVLDMGSVAYTGPGQDLLASQEVRRLYIGG